jgi:FtsH-binding integral membrane protein
LEEASLSTDFQIPQGYQPVAAIGVDARATFINRTYNHLMGAIVLFTLIEVALFQSGYAESIAQVLLGGSWLLVLGAFMLVSWFASRISLTSESKGLSTRRSAASWSQSRSSSCPCSGWPNCPLPARSRVLL